MIGFMNQCPHCGEKSSFVPEELECDKALILWCQQCGNYINQTFSLETIRRWWERFEEGEDSIHPPIPKEALMELLQIESRLNTKNDSFLDKIELHLKDYMNYKYIEGS